MRCPLRKLLTRLLPTGWPPSRTGRDGGEVMTGIWETVNEDFPELLRTFSGGSHQDAAGAREHLAGLSMGNT